MVKKKVLKEGRWEGIECIRVAQNRNKWRDIAYTAINLHGL